MPIDKSIKKVLVIGSGPIVIGQAAEFDYAGAQACRILRQAGVNTVLVNSNPATIMTDSALADEIYLEPLTAETVKRIILKEKPDCVLAGLGGQTALTIAMQLNKEGFLKKHGVRLIGTNADAIDRSEDRLLFKETMEKIGQPVIPSEIATDMNQVIKAAEDIGFPVIIRPAFTLGGSGGGVAYNLDELSTIAENGLMLSPIHQVLVEKYIYGWKEIEFEVMRDKAANVVAVCSMENMDPVGIHTGDSIVIAPAVTLAEMELQMLRKASLDIITELGIEGGCNVQYALDPDSLDYAVIEVNPRVSRSSALASKATGYPIAKVATMIALGMTLDEIKNDATGKTFATFEPVLDYLVVKFPKWPFDKFVTANRTLGTQMKATGEVMAIAKTFEAALMKAVRGAEISFDTLNKAPDSDEDILVRLKKVNDTRLFTVFEALKTGVTIEKINDITKITPWFLEKINNLVKYEALLSLLEGESVPDELYLKGKKLGYTDAAIARISGKKIAASIPAVYKTVKPCSSDFGSAAPYFYSEYNDVCEARAVPESGKKKIIVLGSGPIRIGQGIEFDYSCVHCVWSLRNLGYEVIIVNNNPETVSTDFDTADRLYFEPLTKEDVMNIIKVEKPIGVVVAFGGQTAIKLAKFLHDQKVTILGTSAESIDTAEDREKFDALLGRIGITRPAGQSVMTMAQALKAANELGYPVLLRPSYVIGGQNMTIAHDDASVCEYMEIILSQGIENPVLVDKYLMGTELEVDVISDGKNVLIPGVMEHIERAGVHSGDSIAVYPAYKINDKLMKKVVDCSEFLALSLGTKGLVNIQYLIYRNELYVIEVNPRASRTIPYISKVTGVPMVSLATKVMVGHSLTELGYGTGLYKTPPYVAVKVPVFSFEKLLDVNSSLGPEMKSTGEVLGIGKNLEEALLKGLVSAGYKIGAQRLAEHGGGGVFITAGGMEKLEIVGLAKKLDDLGIKIYATPGTARVVRELGIDVTIVPKDDGGATTLKLLDEGKLAFIVFIGGGRRNAVDDFLKIHRSALRHSIACLTSIDTANSLADIIASRYTQQNTELVDINNMRTEKGHIAFSKMQGTGNDYIYIDNRNGEISCPESLSITFSDRHYGIGADGIVLIENSLIADAKMRMFNKDGSEGAMAGNSIRCVGKFLYDNNIVPKHNMIIETASGIKSLELYTFDGKVRSVSVDMGKAILESAKIPVNLDGDNIVNREVVIGGKNYSITCVSLGNPHAVVFCDRVDAVDVEGIGRQFEASPLFPERVNTEFIRVVNSNTIKMRVWERGNGETWACGTGACAAVVASVLSGKCKKGEDITVKLKGGDLIVNYTDERVLLTGNADLIYSGVIEY